MTRYLHKSFTVPASGKRADPCEHGWLDPRGRCVLCGGKIGTLVGAWDVRWPPTVTTTKPDLPETP